MSDLFFPDLQGKCFCQAFIMPFGKYITERIFYYGKQINMDEGSRTNRI